MKRFSAHSATVVRVAVAALLGAWLVVVVPPVVTFAATDPCGAGSNPVICENSKPGNPPSEWEVGSNSDTIEGFAAGFTYNVGSQVNFKIDTSASAYSINIYRMGYYGGDGARKVATIAPSASLPQNQPNCLNDAATGLIDCGNWSVSAGWTIPATAVSGVYFAHLVRPDTGAENHIMFVVRNDASTSAMLFQTSDTTWQAYNNWGGNSLYQGSPAGRAYKVSYNRPFNTRSTPGGRDFVFANEYPMIRFLERNGYDLSYFSGIDADRSGALILNHQTYLSVGHDEYWSGQQRSNVEAARDAGVNLAFFSGNEVYWKTRWESSIDGSGAAYRTLVTYKETYAGAKIDPNPAWTGTWRDPRLSPPADGGRPENGLTGTIFTVNSGTNPIKVPAADGKMRFWRNTSIATQVAGATATLPDGTLGYEWDEDLDNGARPAGLIRMSTANYDVPEKLIDYGTTVVPGNATHHLTTYRAASGALVFGAGTVQWSWGLDDQHDAPTTPLPPDSRMQQATVNLFADMGAQPGTLMSGLVAATASTDTAAPSATITSPAPGATLANGSQVTVTGTASDAGGGQVAGVEVSTDGGTTWHPATGRAAWSYTYFATGSGAATIRARAIDDSANLQPSPSVLNVTASCPCTLFGVDTPTNSSDPDTTATELGVKVTPSINGWITGVRFYKGSGNTGTHVGSLWSSSGSQLATASFSGESSSGWQTVSFGSAVPVTSGTTYVASYFAPNGRYAADAEYFRFAPKVSPPLTAPQGTDAVGNGVYRSGSAGFPDASFRGANYWVDPVFDTVAPPDVTAPSVLSVSPLNGASSVPLAMKPSVAFSEPVVSGSVTMTLKTAAGATVAGTTAYDAGTQAATFTPGGLLVTSTDYVLTVTGARDPSNNVMSTFSSTFRTAATAPVPGDCPCSIWSDQSVPAIAAVSDPAEVEVGVKFQSDSAGYITGIRFYKGNGNSGTHVGTLWSSTGAELATATFTNESTTGWQQVDFGTPVSVAAGTVYVASYHTTSGFYAATVSGLSSAVVNGPLTALADGSSGPNGVYRYGGRAFPTAGAGANYWVDVVYANPTDTTAPSVNATSPSSGATNVPVSQPVSVTFSEKVVASSAAFTLKGPGGAQIAGTGGFPTSPSKYVFTPSGPLAAGTTYTATMAGATDAGGNVQTTPTSWTVTTAGASACPCTLFSSDAVPTTAASTDTGAVELGLRFTPDTNGFVTGVRFYKGAGNTGTHVGNLWAPDGTRLASATFGAETLGGWQSVSFASAVAVTAGTTYIASYFAPVGRYAADGGYFATSGVDNAPLHAPAGANGVYRYGSSSGFPTGSYNATNYWVDTVFTTNPPPDTIPPGLVSTSPIDGQTSVPTGVTPSATFDEALDPSSLAGTLTSQGGGNVGGAVAYDSTAKRVTFTPASALSAATAYTVSMTGVKDLAGNAVGSPVTWSFTTATAATAGCPCTIWPDSSQPAVASDSDTRAIEVGVKFRTDQSGVIRGIRFYKGAGNTGTHIGNLYNATGTRLATATFTGESTAGWQQVSFATAVPVTANTTYVASYYAPNGGYASNTNGLATGVDNAPLHALASGVDGVNGVYVFGAGGGFPTAGSTTNYWVDAVFTDSSDTTAPTISAVDATGSGTSATVTWTTNEASTSVVQYGTSATSLTSTATAAGSTSSHSVQLTGLAANTRYYYRVTSQDAAGNGATSPAASAEPASYLPPDTSAPTITAVDATGSGTSATVTWTTNEASTSVVQYGTSATSLTSTATAAGSTSSHSVQLTGLAANTRYYYRVTSQDAAGNGATSPSGPTPASYVPTVAPVVQTTAADFGTGTAASTYVGQSGNGEVLAAPTIGSEFSGSTVPSGWTSTVYATGGSSTVSSGVVTENGARIRSSASTGTRSVQFSGTFPASTGQIAGFGTTGSGLPYAAFSTQSGVLYARTGTTTANATQTALAANLVGGSHLFRIDRTTTGVVYSVDGSTVATHAINTTASSMRLVISDTTVGGAALSVDWMRMAPYAASATYTSRVVDAVGPVTWGALSWTASVPASTTLTVQVRTGSTASPDASWSAWRTIASSGGAINGQARYAQLRLVMTSTGTRLNTPVVNDVTLAYAVT